MAADVVASTIAEVTLGKGRVEQALSLTEQAVAMARKTGGIWAEGKEGRLLPFNPEHYTNNTGLWSSPGA